MEYISAPNSTVLFRAQLAATDTNLYPRLYVYDRTNTVITGGVMDLDHVANGLYVKEFNTTIPRGKYYTQIIVYTDPDHLNPATDIIQPDSDSLNVGNGAFGGVANFGTGSVGTRKRTPLTEAEIKKIAKAVLEILQPELDKKSEFNPATDVVKTDYEQDDAAILAMKDEMHSKIDSLQSVFSAIIASQQNESKSVSEAAQKKVDEVIAQLTETADHIDTAFATNQDEVVTEIVELRKTMDTLSQTLQGFTESSDTSSKDLMDMLNQKFQNAGIIKVGSNEQV